MLFNQCHHLLQQTIFECTAALSIRCGPAPSTTGLAEMMETALTDISGMFFVYFLPSVLCPLAVYSTCLLYTSDAADE